MVLGYFAVMLSLHFAGTASLDDNRFYADRQIDFSRHPSMLRPGNNVVSSGQYRAPNGIPIDFSQDPNSLPFSPNLPIPDQQHPGANSISIIDPKNALPDNRPLGYKNAPSLYPEKDLQFTVQAEVLQYGETQSAKVVAATEINLAGNQDVMTSFKQHVLSENTILGSLYTIGSFDSSTQNSITTILLEKASNTEFNYLTDINQRVPTVESQFQTAIFSAISEDTSREQELELKSAQILELLPSPHTFVELGVIEQLDNSTLSRDTYLNFYASCLVRQGEPSDHCFESEKIVACIAHDDRGCHMPAGYLWGCFINNSDCPAFRKNIWGLDCEGSVAEFLRCLTGSNSSSTPGIQAIVGYVCLKDLN
eukprot:Gregarina_sp_Poly_1__4246@NODE_2314_length_2309_cov_55_248885_g1481_i0_p1_GENE_NODE_2314_length_2309_cov_55_248885_g1481_i0NODE_2314_length_2309_cov_55_248885_g1481_i0_p1_ORF_typecomplete_len366_score34_24_NODE_2314_length_2309_cov_55_248885_g1481_i0791176